MLIIYGVLGLIGLMLSRKLGFVNIWDEKVSNKQRFLIPAFVGIVLGIFFIFNLILISQSSSVFKQMYYHLALF